MSCDTTGPDDPVPPKRVMLVKRVAGADTLETMQGISALPGEENRVKIMWHKPNINENIKSFKIFRSKDDVGLINYVQYAAISVTNPGNPDTTFTDLHVDIGTTYHYFITAVNNDGLESAPSDTASISLLVKASLRGPVNGAEITQKEDIEFRWNRENTPPYYIIRIEEYFSQTFHRMIFVKKIFNTNYQPDQTFVLSAEDAGSIMKDGFNYRWRIDAVEDPEFPVDNPNVTIYKESRSEYYMFKVNWNTK
jgi:hypothetical protein